MKQTEKKENIDSYMYRKFDDNGTKNVNFSSSYIIETHI